MLIYKNFLSFSFTLKVFFILPGLYFVYDVREESRIIFFSNMDKHLFPHYLLNSHFHHPHPQYTLLSSASESVFTHLWIHFYRLTILSFGLFFYPCSNTTLPDVHRCMNLAIDICQGNPHPHSITHAPLFLFLKSILTVCEP